MYFPTPKLDAARKITGKPELKTHNDIYDAVAELKAANQQYGDSDGRVTQIAYLMEALEELESNEKALSEAERRGALSELIRREKAELASLERQYAGDRYGDRMLEKTLVWTDKGGRRHTRRYTTERGFLKAYIRLLEADAHIWRAE